MSRIEFTDVDKIDIVDRIINILPEIKKKRNYIINQILTPKSTVSDEYVLEKISENGKSYYRDKYKCILDDNGDLVGIWEWNFNENNFTNYIFTDERGKILNN
jgi:hypothetical protein